METVLIQITNNKAYKLLEDLEDLQILKVIKKMRSQSKSFLKNMPENYRVILQTNYKIMLPKAAKNGTTAVFN